MDDDGTQPFGHAATEGFGGHVNWFTPEWRAEMQRKYGQPSPYGVATSLGEEMNAKYGDGRMPREIAFGTND